MFWHVSRLVITTWRHRLAQLLRRMPGLWLLLPLLLLALPLTGLLAYGFFHELGESLLVGDGLVQQLRPLVMLSLCNLFLVFSFMILSLVIMLSPDDTRLRRMMLPLPLSSLQLRVGLLLPGLLMLMVIQSLLWGPAWLALVNLGLITPLQLVLALVLALLCYDLLTLAFHQAMLYGALRLFGRERPGIRLSILGLGLVVGLVLLDLPLFTLTSVPPEGLPAWTLLLPVRWMALVLEPHPEAVLAGVGLLLTGALLTGALYGLLLVRCERLTTGTRGQWAPLRWLPFTPRLWWASCAYELKSLCRYDYLVIDSVTVFGIWLAALVGLLLTRTANPLLFLLLAQVAPPVFLPLLASLSQTSWGRDRQAYRVLAATPLELHLLLSAKFWTCLVLTFVLWSLATLVLLLVAGHPDLMLLWLPPALLLPPLCFVMGILLPYSTDDPLSTLTVGAVLLLIDVPLSMLYLHIQEMLHSLPGGTIVQMLIEIAAALLLVLALYRGSLWLGTARLRQERG
ncbi:MAG: hypothetical protein IRZ31_01245 [Thermogemmatispora sp.]|uniref:hypothetical protein n=1 Tax=Thermogemmatispora sp. TaxID=1968838 RepID=UPI00261B4F8A|nr:hypothetical protein [Thermogemmatispora sp.]MBX5455497.1 hypothetical protein [Thermogemmatispora sp.]